MTNAIQVLTLLLISFIDRDKTSKMNQRQAETEEQAALVREKHRLAMKNQRQVETDEQAVLARE